MKKSVRKPDFFILGAPKSGTTAISTYLREHPDVFFSVPKEPHYFSKDLPSQGKHNNYSTDEEYLRLFQGAEEFRAVGEASTRYLYSRIAVKRILEFQPNARFIVILRNPINLFFSLHSHLLHLKEEEIRDPEKAWRAQFDREKGKGFPLGCRDRESLLYGRVCSLGEQVERLLGTVESERVLLLFHEDLLKDPRKSYEAILAFLGLPDDGRMKFPRVNKRKGGADSLTYRLLSSPPRSLLRRWEEIKKVLGIKQVGVLSGIRSLLARKGCKKGIRSDFRRELLDYFRKDVQRISQICQRDLEHWLR